MAEMEETVTEEKVPIEEGTETEGGEDDNEDTVKENKVTVFSPSDVEVVKCDCCNLTEECTIAYIADVRDRYQGRWICGLCAEAVMDEINRSAQRITQEEAVNRHTTFCEEFRSPPDKPTEELITAVKHLLIRSLESPTSVRSNPASPRGKDGSDLARATFGRSHSCFPSMDA